MNLQYMRPHGVVKWNDTILILDRIIYIDVEKEDDNKFYVQVGVENMVEGCLQFPFKTKKEALAALDDLLNTISHPIIEEEPDARS